MRLSRLLLVFLAMNLVLTGFLMTATAEEAYESEIQEWREWRMEALRGPRGYLNLVGLLRLSEGAQSFGFAGSDDLRLGESSSGFGETIGEFVMAGERVVFNAAAGVEVLCDGQIVKTIVACDGSEDRPLVLEMGSLRWFVIQRGRQTLVRVRDLDSARVRDFRGFESYPIDPAWRFEATFIPFSEPTSFTVPNVLGEMEVMKSTGKLSFTHAGETYLLDAADEGDVLFVIFGDTTNGSETYGGGRFVYVDKPPNGGATILDFNKAYNPPCSFSAFTTCPLPPKGNILPMAIRVGERVYREAR